MPNRIKSYREKSGMTLEQLAERTGSSKAYMWSLENKASPKPTVQLAIKLARAFGVTVEQLFAET
ncbi:toxin-antitoxin system, antitoxin component, Xre family [Roseibium sp. TrichSKD4]|uniref:helix-turn-helix transcriptional regulator n=1 Tax=Roseibium sp. TrichSKD4 TaxID=744980 RepID=UPI0001E56655|nr:helix-turn-helix transcriptional regulator [Roseibium sp. TrichSKD4]EFO30153.1 toxin-antitoxin system, antitoxin component, Xre family [Roseibium sp. TrichSKD4]EFO33567.1 toxin-antitoxin system, antitoxin component, Xre family [Roseibium sp. TrichSKD4]